MLGWERSKTPKKLVFFRLLLCGGLFYLLYRQFPVERFQEDLFRMRITPLLLAAGGYLAIQLAVALRFSLALGAVEIHVPLRRALHLHFISLFFNMFLPGAIGGDAAKGYYLRASSDHLGKGFLGALLDRYLGLIGLASLALVAGIMLNASRIRGVAPLPWILGILALAYSAPYFLKAGWIRGVVRRLVHRSARAMDAVRAADEAVRAARRPRVLAFGALLTFIYYLGSAGVHLLMARSFGVDLEYWTTMYLVVAVALVSSLPILPGAYGQREGAYVVFFSTYGLMSRHQSFLLAGLALGMLMMTAAIGGCLYLLEKGQDRKVLETRALNASL